MNTDERNAIIGVELGAKDIIDPLASPAPLSPWVPRLPHSSWTPMWTSHPSPFQQRHP